MLIGSGIVRIDDGGRIKIPSEFAKSIIENYGTELYITSIQGHNALIYPLGEWRKTLDRVSAAPSMDPGIRKFVYVTGYYGKQSALDSKERILIHPLLRERARLNGELILIGNINSLVLWNREEFEKEYIDVPFTDDELRGLSEKKESDVHVPVMVETVQELLRASQGGTFFDGTIGMGGHGAAILGANPSNVLWGNDKDGEALEICREKLPADRTTLLRGDFRQILSHQVEIFDGFLFDLGVSSFQLDRPEKGFSYSRPAPLDMRMDDRLELTAAGVVNTYGYEELMRVFRDYGEFGRPDRLVKELMMARRRTPFQSTDQLKEFVRSLYPRQKTMDPLARVFQALRIEVNGELDGLEEFLLNLIERMKRGARIVVISFHSLEDRIVKNSLKAASEKKLLTLLTKKPLTAASEEVEGNPRSRSAKVRAGERT